MTLVLLVNIYIYSYILVCIFIHIYRKYLYVMPALGQYHIVRRLRGKWLLACYLPIKYAT